jgi:hypothetical protein
LKPVESLFFFVTEFTDIEIIVQKGAPFDKLKVRFNNLIFFYNGSLTGITTKIGKYKRLLHDLNGLKTMKT